MSLVFTPVFYVVMQRLSEMGSGKKQAEAGTDPGADKAAASSSAD